MDARGARIAFVVCAGACLAQGRLLSARLPPFVASHFDAAGRPNAWMPRGTFVNGYALVVLFLAVVLAGAAYGVKRLPNGLINLPNKKYWLAPERRDESLSTFEVYMLWFGAATFALLFEVFGQVFRVNYGLAPKLEHPLASLGVYAAFALVWCLTLLRRFSRPSA